MLPVISVLESLNTLAPSVITGIAGQTKDVLPDRSGSNKKWNYNIAYRAIQNVSAGNIYVAFGVDADGTTNFHKLLTPNTDMSISSLERVSVYGAGVWAVVVIEQNRLLS